MMKRVRNAVLAGVFGAALVVSGFGMPVRAEEATDVSSVPLTKTVKTSSATAFIPETSYTFTVENWKAENTGAKSYTDTTMPSFGQASYTVDLAGKGTDGKIGSEKKFGKLDINLPTYDTIGDYYYVFSETAGTEAGMAYDTGKIALRVHVTYNAAGELVRQVQYYTVTGEKSSYSLGKKKGTIDVNGDGDTEDAEDTAFAFENVYTAGQLKVAKTVAGKMGDRNKEFPFTITVTLPSGKTSTNTVSLQKNSEVASTSSTWNAGVMTLSANLKHGDYVTITNLPKDATVAVTEQKGDYTQTSTLKTGTGSAVTNDLSAITITGEDMEASVTNTKDDDEDITTGIFMNNMAYIIMIGAALVLIAGFAVSRRRNR